jgi:hypothetical protein
MNHKTIKAAKKVVRKLDDGKMTAAPATPVEELLQAVLAKARSKGAKYPVLVTESDGVLAILDADSDRQWRIKIKLRRR